MKLLICGAGRVARELVRQLGDEWAITLIDKDTEELERTKAANPEIVATLTEDASSPVVLAEAGIEDFDYVLALTRSDEVNRAVANAAREAGVAHVSIVLTDAEDMEQLRESGVHVVHGSKLVSGHLYHYLQDPRILVAPLSLGPASVMEVRAADHMRAVGKRAAYFRRKRSRLAGIFREGRLVFPRPDTLIRADDRLILLGDPDIFQSVCQLLDCGNPHFPLAYGPGLLVAVNEEPGAERLPPVLMEGLYLARSTAVKSATLLNCCDAEEGNAYEQHLTQWPQNVSVEVRRQDPDMARNVRAAAAEGNYGLVVMPPVEESLFDFLARPTYVGLADDVDRPLLVARGSVPFERILVPFNATAMSELALEIAVDLSRQLEASITTVVVQEADFVTGTDEGEWKDEMLARLREMEHVHKVALNPQVREGNPVREIVAMSGEYDLLIVGSTNRNRSILAPNVGENLARQAECSVLIVAF